MKGTPYEEFCRLFLADKLGIPVEVIKSRRIPSATHPDLPEYDNQIDLYWEDRKDITLYKNFADAKWRGGSRKVSIGEVRQLQHVKEDIDAHKAMMITNTDFTKKARALAENKGIALHIVRPNFDYTILDLASKNREQIQLQLQESFNSSKPPYTHEIVYRAFDFGTGSTAQTSVPGKTVSHSKVIEQTSMDRIAQTPSHRRAPTGTQKGSGRQGGPGQKGPGPARGGGGKPTRGR